MAELATRIAVRCPFCAVEVTAAPVRTVGIPGANARITLTVDLTTAVTEISDHIRTAHPEKEYDHDRHPEQLEARQDRGRRRRW